MRLFTIPVIFIAGFLANIVDVSSDTDVSAGERIYTQCTGCHAPDYNRTGPKHCGLLGRAAGGVTDFDYTRAMSDSGITWTKKSLDQFLHSPFTFIPGTSMGFAGIPSARARQQLVAYLSQLDNNNAICK
jgi:cytochrome c